MIPLLLTLTPAFAQETPVDEGAYSHHLNQAKLFVKKGWTSDALAELAAAVAANPDGFEAWWLTAQLRFELMEARAAWEAAERAAELGEDDEAAAAQQLEDFLKSTYGELTIVGPYEAAASILQLEPTGPILDPELKRWIDKVALSLRARTLLPMTISVPAGTYTVNGQSVEVVAGRERDVTLARDDLGAAGLAKLLVPRVEIGTGVGIMFSDRVSNLQPSLETQLGFTQPFGRLIFGAMVDYSLRAYQSEAGTTFNPRAVGGGLRFGTELMVGGPLAVRPSIGYRFALVPGVPLACSAPDIDGAYACTPPGDDLVPAANVYAVGRAHIPFGEVAVDWRRAGRTTATGFGVRAAVERAIGTIPETSEAMVIDSEDTISFTVEDNTWTATGIRLLAELSLTL